jgi:hypothetical protein
MRRRSSMAGEETDETTKCRFRRVNLAAPARPNSGREDPRTRRALRGFPHPSMEAAASMTPNGDRR